MGRRPNSPDERARRQRAYLLVRKALRSGELIRPEGCADCPSLHAHHHLGYDHPLDVVWLCETHHGAAHSGRGSLRPIDNLDRAYLGWRIQIAEMTIAQCSAQLAEMDKGDAA